MTREQLERWRADPVAFASTLTLRRPDNTVGPPVLSARQQGWLAALGEREGNAPKYRTLGIVGPKRSGKTLVSAIALLSKSLGPDRRSVCLANSELSAQSLGFEECGKLLEAAGPLHGLAEVQRGRIAFPAWRSEILALPCSAKTVAGITVSGLLVSDELWQADSPTPWRLLRGQASGTESQALMVSQASGIDSDVYALYQASQSGAPGLWFDYCGPEDCEREGNPNPYIDAAFLAQERALLPEAIYRHYYLAEWGVSGSLLLDPGAVERTAAAYEFPQGDWEWAALRATLPPGTTFAIGAGLDRAQAFSGGDESALCFVARATIPGQLEPTYYVIGGDDFGQDSTEGAILTATRRARATFGRQVQFIAETYQSQDLAVRLGAELRAATSGAQMVMFSLLSRAVREGRLWTPRDEPFGQKLRQQLSRFGCDLSGPTVKFGTKGKATDDLVYSLAWALLAASEALAPQVVRQVQLTEREPMWR